MPFTDHAVEIDGCKTHYRRAGKGTPLVFLHGAGGAPVVLPFMEKLATRFDVLVPDHPGYGWKPSYQATYEYFFTNKGFTSSQAYPPTMWQKTGEILPFL